MRCSRCGVCCTKTEMLLSKADIKRLENAGYDTREFVRFDKQGFAQLRNIRGYCFFYEVEKHGCRVYSRRPVGCRIYPVMYSEDEGVVVDDLCPLAGTVSQREIGFKAGRLKKLLGKIDAEARKRRARV